MSPKLCASFPLRIETKLAEHYSCKVLSFISNIPLYNVLHNRKVCFAMGRGQIKDGRAESEICHIISRLVIKRM